MKKTRSICVESFCSSKSLIMKIHEEIQKDYYDFCNKNLIWMVFSSLQISLKISLILSFMIKPDVYQQT